MGKEKITPDRKSVPSSGGIKEGHTHLTTPKSKTDDSCPGYASEKGKDKIM